MKTESIDKKHKKKEDSSKLLIEEPKELYSYTKTSEDLILDSNAEMDLLLERLKKTRYDKKLAEFYSTFTNDFDDLTEI